MGHNHADVQHNISCVYITDILLLIIMSVAELMYNIEWNDVSWKSNLMYILLHYGMVGCGGGGGGSLRTAIGHAMRGNQKVLC